MDVEEGEQDESVQREKALLALRLTEEVLAFVEAAHSPHLDWPVIARHLAPHHQPALSPRECRALWRKLAYRNSNRGRSAEEPIRAAHQQGGQSDGDEPQHNRSQQQQEEEEGHDAMEREEVRVEAGGTLRTKKRKSHGGDQRNQLKRRDTDRDPDSGDTAVQPESLSVADVRRRDEKRPRASPSPIAAPAGAEAEGEAQQGAARTSGGAGGRAGGNPLGTPHPEPPAAEASGGGDTQQKVPRKRTMWTNEEDMLLLRGVQRNGEGNWAAILRDQMEGSLLLRRNSTQLAQRWNAIKRKIQRAHYAGLDEATKILASELVSASQAPSPPQRESNSGGVNAPPPDVKSEEDEQPPVEQPFHQPPPGPSRVFD